VGAPVPAEIAAQLALYRALLAGIHPDRPVRVFVVWTSGPVIRELGPELDEALRRLAEDGAAGQVEG
jgi:ATP-dependent helicase/nuclease subunit A